MAHLLDLVKLAEEILPIAIKLPMLLVVKLSLLFGERGSDYTPVAVSGQEHDKVYVATFPAILYDMIFSSGRERLDLDPVVVGAIRDEYVGSVTMVKNRQEYLPSVLHEPADDHAFVGCILQRLMGTSMSLG